MPAALAAPSLLGLPSHPFPLCWLSPEWRFQDTELAVRHGAQPSALPTLTPDGLAGAQVSHCGVSVWPRLGTWGGPGLR